MMLPVAGALSKVELTRKELEAALSRARQEEAALRDALHRLQVLNDGLVHDKAELIRAQGQVHSYHRVKCLLAYIVNEAIWVFSRNKYIYLLLFLKVCLQFK